MFRLLGAENWRGGGGGAGSGDLMKNLETPGKTGRVGRHVVNIVVDTIN